MRSFFDLQEGVFEVGIREVGGYKIGEKGGQRLVEWEGREDGESEGAVMDRGEKKGVIIEEGEENGMFDEEGVDEKEGEQRDERCCLIL